MSAIRWAAGAVAGTLAGVVMSAFMMAWMVAVGSAPFAMPNAVAAMWLGPAVATDRFSIVTLLGFLTHEATSAAMGLVAIPFIRDLSTRRTLLASVAYAVASYPIVFAFVLRWANPILYARAEMLPLTIGHAVFGIAMGLIYAKLAGVRKEHGMGGE